MEMEKQDETSDEEALIKLASIMKDNATTQEEKQNIHTFLNGVVEATDTKKVANLRDGDDGNLDELGIPSFSVRGSLDMALISEKIMDNDYFKEYFEKEAENTLATSLSRKGFLIRQATVKTTQVADITKKRKINKGWFKKNTEETGGDVTQ